MRHICGHANNTGLQMLLPINSVIGGSVETPGFKDQEKCGNNHFA